MSVCVWVLSFGQIIVIFYGRREGNEMENQIKYLNRHREGEKKEKEIEMEWERKALYGCAENLLQVHFI